MIIDPDPDAREASEAAISDALLEEGRQVIEHGAGAHDENCAA